ALPVFVPLLLFPALIMSIMTVTFVRLMHGRNLTLLGIGITTMVAGGFVALRSIPFGIVAVIVYAISAVRTTAALGIVMRDEVRVAALMRSLAATDPLTGLPNRSRFAAEFEEALDRTRNIEGRLAVLTIDLNGFKEVNDLFGHDAGDELLEEVANRLSSATAGHFVARQGGDEFSVLISDATSVNPSMVAEHIHRALHDPIELSRVQVTCGASIGIAFFPDHGDTTSELTTRADLAMYAAKRAHRRTLTYCTESGQITNQSLRLVGELEPALASGQIAIDYRPVERLSDRTTVGADAEVVWHHPTDGTLLVKDLEGLLGLASFGGVLWRWGLDEACSEAMRRNLDPEVPWTVGIRVLATNLESPHLVADVALALQQSGLAPERLRIHVAESLVLSDAATTSRFFEELGRLGVCTAIDDFGTAHTSLIALSRMDVASIRLAPALAHTLTDPRCELAVASLLELADDLGLRMVAQGLDTPSIAEHAKEVGITYGQGAAIGRDDTSAEASQVAELART
ncbi:MAG: putative bifunctional diguanylate cyclase/phosphodiesterase, partial [Acidimicrobiales bacterium]